MNSSHDLGGTTGAETLAVGYTPGLPLRVFLVLPRSLYRSVEEADCIAAIRQYVGDVELVNPAEEKYQEKFDALISDPATTDTALAYWAELAASCGFCVVIPFADSCVGSGMWVEIETFFHRFKTEARVYEYQRLAKILYARREEYFRVPGRILDRDETHARIYDLTRG